MDIEHSNLSGISECDECGKKAYDLWEIAPRFTAENCTFPNMCPPNSIWLCDDCIKELTLELIDLDIN